MNPSEQTPAEWPNRIYYVCNSGSGIVVNATPLVQAGADRVAGMQILCGVRNQRTPTPAEQRESIRPAKRLTAFARHRGMVVDNPIYGAPDSYAAWRHVLNEAAGRAGELDATVVYNVTGGPRSVPLAAIIGASNSVRASMVALAVSFRDRRCTQLMFDSSGALAGESTLPAHGRIGFDGLITLYGYREQNPDERRRHEAFLGDHQYIAGCVLAETNRRDRRDRRGGKSAVAALHWSMQFDAASDARGESATPFCVEVATLRAPPDALQRVVTAFDGLDGLKVVRGKAGRVLRIEVETEVARRFVGGVWLEAAVFGSVREVFRRTRAEVVAGAVLAVEGRPPRSSNIVPDDTELDVAVVLDDQIHVIEVKAVTRTGSAEHGRKFGDHIAKLVKIRQELGSQVMRSYLVAPLLSRSELERGSFVERAEKQGVRLLYGHRALQLLGRELSKLADGRQPG